MFGNPGDAANLSAAAIAAAIGADISGQSVRLVDNKPVAYTGGANLTNLGAGPVPVLTQVDVSAGVMVNVGLSNILAPTGSTALATAPAGTVGFDLLFTWYDATGTVVLFAETYEINCFPRLSVGQSIVTSWSATIPCRGALLSVTAINPLATLWATGVGGGFAMTLTTSSRPIPTTVRGYNDGSALDGILLATSGTNAANGSTILVAGPGRGRLFVSLLGATTMQTIDLAWGLARVGVFRNVTTWPATGASSSPLEIPATNRPLSLKITNNSGTVAGAYNVSVWTAPNQQ
jgi:hypothetical protein